MPVISVCSTKGGVGKTTLVICLAEAVSHQGGTVAILDADPNGHVQTWREVAGDESKVVVYAGVTQKTIHDVIEEASKIHSIVFIDLEGAASKTVTYAIASSDLVLIPTRSSGPDLQEVFRTYDVVQEAEKMLRRKISTRAIFCQVPPGNRVSTHASKQIVERGIPVMRTQTLMRPVAYSQIHFTGITPAHPEGEEKARVEINNVLEEVVAIFHETAEAA